MIRTSGWRGDRGAVTVEAALGMAVLVMVLALVLGALAAIGAQLRCVDAARETARLVARGEPDRAREVGQVVAPADARLEITVVGDEVTVGVTSDVLDPLPGLSVSARAVGVLEPGAFLPDADSAPDPDPSGSDGEEPP